MSLKAQDNSFLQRFNHHYEAFRGSGADIKEYQKPNGMQELQFSFKDYKVHCHAITLLDGVSLDFGNYEGDFSTLGYHIKSPSVHFGILQSGHYSGLLDDNNFSIKSKESFCVAPDTHKMGAKSSANCFCVQISCDVMEARKDFRKLFSNFEIERLYEKIAKNPIITPSCPRILGLYDVITALNNIDLLRLKVCESLLEISQVVDNEIKHKMHGANYAKNAYIKRVNEYLQSNYFLGEDELSLKHLSQKFEVCVSKLTADFKLVNNMSIYQFLKLVKMQNAFKLLRQGFSVTQAANEVGYINVSCFCKNFYEVYGKSPKAFKV